MKESPPQKTIKKPAGPIVFKDRKSKFYGYSFPISSEEEVKKCLEDLKKKHPNANHFCYAWVIGQHPSSFRTNDDGEPANSAGQPIYRQIGSFNLSNCLVVVVRFFGGTKLGVGGLINAYKTAAKWTIEESRLMDFLEEISFELQFEYPQMNSVMRIIKKNDLTVTHQIVKEFCTLQFKVSKDSAQEIAKAFSNIYGLRLREL